MSEKNVVGVRFRRVGKVYYFDPGATSPAPGDTVIVETARGTEAAEVVVGPRQVPDSSITQPLRSVVRKATDEDMTHLQENRRKEKEALKSCEEKVAEHGLDMHLVGAEYTFDRSKLIFYFTSEGRVDFRNLVRDLSAVFKTRIELRQIGVRDEAKMLGGLGSCGRQLCCCTFLSEFQPVSIRMAKRQDLSLNPTKISGLCGRLMCCLRYECDSYPDPKRAGADVAAAGCGPRAAPDVPIPEASPPETAAQNGAGPDTPGRTSG
jgi:cell fate regulator YaaT (PSP1 superfamily)